MRWTSVVLAVLASARLTRFVVRDDLAKWWIKDPIDRAMDEYAAGELLEADQQGREPVEPWWWKYRSGLDCPWCVGFWVSLGVAGVAGMRYPPIRLGLAGMAINYLTVHAGERLGDYDDEEGHDELSERDEPDEEA